MLHINDIVGRIEQYQPQADGDLVRRAYDFAREAHNGQMRKSGDPYFIHPASVAGIITELRLDVASVCAGLLHDVVEDTAVTSADLDREFGPEIAFLVDGVTKLNKIDFNSRKDRQAESFRKMVGAMARDIRVLVVKLCDRLDNMRTLEFMSTDGQERIARETMDIYAPLAHRLGLQRFKAEFQDLSFSYLDPDGYAALQKLLNNSAAARDLRINRVCRQLTSELAEHGFAAKVTGATKHIHSVHRKMKERKCEFDQVYDLIGFAVVVESVADCYGTLGVIHSMWTPVPGRFKDFVALPKPNMYQSLHTSVFGQASERVEVHIRTHEMHQVAEHGIAAHWRYTTDNSGGLDRKDAVRFAWLRRLMETQDELKDPAEFFESIKVELFQDEVSVFSPRGEILVFPRGATPIDFAYAIHTDLGDHFAGARVNGSAVTHSYNLRNGDLVEVMTNPQQHPSKEWLDYVVSSRARSKIRSHLRNRQRQRSLKLGRELLHREFANANMSLERLEDNIAQRDRVAARFGVRKLGDLFVNIGYGKVRAPQVVDFLAPEHKAPPELRENRIKAFLRKMRGRNVSGILLNGTDDVLVRYTKCCNPLPGDDIVGFMSRGRGITVHRRECERAFDADPDRKVEICWDTEAKISRPVALRVITANRPGILATVGQTFHTMEINISEATCRADDAGRATNTFRFLCSDVATLNNVVRQLKKIDGVIEVARA